MATTAGSSSSSQEKDLNMATTQSHDHVQQSHLEHYGPLSHVSRTETRLRAFGGELQLGLYRSSRLRKFGNPAPLGLSAFALTTFVLGLINMGTRDITKPNIVVGLAMAYGGLVQLCSGMWYASGVVEW